MLQMTTMEEFGLLAWLLKNPARILVGPFPSMLMLPKMHFRSPRAQWLARAIIVNGGDPKGIAFDAQRAKQTWFHGFQAEMEKTPENVQCPDELKAKLIRIANHPEFNFSK